MHLRTTSHRKCSERDATRLLFLIGCLGCLAAREATEGFGRDVSALGDEIEEDARAAQ